jgi:hypothetical protein
VKVLILQTKNWKTALWAKVREKGEIVLRATEKENRKSASMEKVKENEKRTVGAKENRKSKENVKALQWSLILG